MSSTPKTSSSSPMIFINLYSASPPFRRWIASNELLWRDCSEKPATSKMDLLNPTIGFREYQGVRCQDPPIVVTVLIYIPASYLVGSSLYIAFTESISEIQ